jgi:hypothetical protein
MLRQGYSRPCKLRTTLEPLDAALSGGLPNHIVEVVGPAGLGKTQAGWRLGRHAGRLDSYTSHMEVHCMCFYGPITLVPTPTSVQIALVQASPPLQIPLRCPACTPFRSSVSQLRSLPAWTMPTRAGQCSTLIPSASSTLSGVRRVRGGGITKCSQSCLF